ncbi:MAG: DUF1998 domain-containing protein [Parabacteroides sp.]|nr:DUF1998 domain-containing protein [Parabacteroides sp.]
MAYSNKPIRRSQLISPWGVGAIVPFPNDESLMIAGLDMWRYNISEEFIIKEDRLQKRLGVKELRWPPDFRERSTDPDNYNLKIPAVRFPTWHYCPFCGTMQKIGYYTKQPICDCFQWPKGRKCNPQSRYKRKLIPERFVVVCPDGHIDDFPVAEWLHYDYKHPYDSATCHIRRSTGGTSAALTGVFYECSCGAKKSIAGATRPGVLKKIGYKCNSAKPWLGIEKDEENPCIKDDVKVLLRGATNVWFADTRSSIHIPTEDETTSRKIIGILQEFFNVLRTQRVNGEWNKDFINILADKEHVDRTELYEAFVKKNDNMEGLEEVTEEMTEDEYRLAEYKVLIKSSGGDALDFHTKNYPISVYDPVIHKFFRSISLVPKLRETRAFIGFSRLEPKNISISERKKMLRLGDGDWLPAIEVYGEGIFFEFNSEVLLSWASQGNVKDRIGKLDRAYRCSNFNKNASGHLRSEFVLIHTFAHLLINQLSFECGYGSSSIRERIYCEKTSNKCEMYGVLIYTASGDSEGSLGGLVRQGEKGRIEDTIVLALKNALWCTSDPICIQSAGQGPESCNLAACHNCALLPETCCECGNRLLDRGLVIGTLSDNNIGLFDNIRKL